MLCGAGAEQALAALWQGWPQAVLVGDDTTDRLFGDAWQAALTPRAEVLRLRFPPGEESKVRATKARLEDAMLAAGVGRGACVVAVGGGVVLDLAGFVAATYMRGIAHLNVATTLLAQVDAAVGGKTGVNTPHGKNLVGAFHHPRGVLLDTESLASLPDDELRSGLAEAVKHAVLRDAALFERIEAWAADPLRASLVPPAEVIARCTEIKAEVVATDDRDQGMRHILNYGHTVAHGIEHATGHAVPHGHAVAIGMVVETRLAVQAGRFDASSLARLVALLDALGLPTAPPCDFAAARPFFGLDKKADRDTLRCAIPRHIGGFEPVDGRWLTDTPVEALARAWCG